MKLRLKLAARSFSAIIYEFIFVQGEVPVTLVYLKQMRNGPKVSYAADEVTPLACPAFEGELAEIGKNPGILAPCGESELTTKTQRHQESRRGIGCGYVLST